MKKELNLSEKKILSEYGKLMQRRWMEQSTPEQRKAISEKARLAGLTVRRANAARRKAEKETA